ncbi:MAG: RnfABCDGE type electron transport complex subunit D [Nitrospiraceae bacterium]|nr:MAG: RnfABCDGE type electron transport complex subunit D [Nitrospiraceae bacterium]
MAEPKAHELVVSVSPHVRGKETVERIMWTVNLALLPAFIMSVYYFGPLAAYVTGLCILTSVLFEHFYQIALKKKSTIGDGSAFLTGLLLGLNLPPTVPFYIPVVGSLIAIVITKLLFGGLGYNVFNPALIGRAFLLISFPKLLTTWSAPTAKITGMDAQTMATPLGLLKEEGLDVLLHEMGKMKEVETYASSDLYMDLLTGNVAGSLGETSVIALLIGAALLFYRGYITWHIPFSFLATVGVMAWAFGGEGLFSGDPLIHLLSGGLILGAFFMATDYVTCPSVRKGQIIFGIGCGAITMLIRLKGGFPEGVMFAILLMNCFAPIIDRSIKPDLFGAVRVKKEKKS